jgi:hypothetical protein
MAIGAAHSVPAASADSARSGLGRIDRYLIASRQHEIALARTAAPPAVSMHAAVMVLTVHGYVTAVRGSNGFVCLVTRAWDNAASVDRARFWDPRTIVPYCLNAAGVRSMLAEYLMKTQWVLAGASEAEIGARIRTARAAGKIESAAGAVCYMMSKQSRWVGGSPGPWRPHLMFYFPNGQAPNWGANLPGSPVFSGAADDDDTTVFMVLVPVWSDGSPAPGR